MIKQNFPPFPFTEIVLCLKIKKIKKMKKGVFLLKVVEKIYILSGGCREILYPVEGDLTEFSIILESNRTQC